MQPSADAPHGREPLSYANSLHPDARLLAFGRLWDAAAADVESLERRGAAPQKIDDAIMMKLAITKAVGRASCTSIEGARVLLTAALDGAREEQGGELDANWRLVAKALETLQRLPA